MTKKDFPFLLKDTVLFKITSFLQSIFAQGKGPSLPCSNASLAVDGPVDDVEEGVGTWKDHPRVLVYGVSVDPDVNVGPGTLHLARRLIVPHSELG